ncbi:MAG: hypothetical protein P8O22_05815 [Akkermansiaceae bacterium]|nr:hypothetical protein [Akkermansiaceae bacterium]
MKVNLFQVAAAVSITLSIFLVSCGENKKSNVDILDSIADEIITTINRVPNAMATITDKESAHVAVKEMKQVGVDIENIADRLLEVEVPSAAEKKRIDRRIADGIADGNQKMSNLDPKVMEDPEIKKIIEEALESLSETLKKVEPIFSEYVKDI